MNVFVKCPMCDGRGEVEAVVLPASTARRGKPPSQSTLERVSEIVNEDWYGARGRIRQEFGVSLRTASRYIEKAREMETA